MITKLGDVGWPIHFQWITGDASTEGVDAGEHTAILLIFLRRRCPLLPSPFLRNVALTELLLHPLLHLVRPIRVFVAEGVVVLDEFCLWSQHEDSPMHIGMDRQKRKVYIEQAHPLLSEDAARLIGLLRHHEVATQIDCGGWSQRAGEQIHVVVHHIVVEPTIQSSKTGMGDGGCRMDGNP